jgi:protein SCO1/2
MPTASKSNKKTTYLWVSIIVFIFGIVTIPSLVSRIKKGAVVDNNRLTLTTDVLYGSNDETLTYLMGPEGARQIPDFSFTDQNGNILSAGDLKGKVIVLDFFFTTCPTICPIMSKNMAELANEFKGDEVVFISISINPFYDTPERLLSYQNKYLADANSWFLLTGQREEIYTLAEKGFFMVAQENEAAPGGFEHSGLFALIDSEGYFRSSKDDFGNPLIYYRGTITREMGVDSDGETEQISQLVSDIRSLLNEKK